MFASAAWNTSTSALMALRQLVLQAVRWYDKPSSASTLYFCRAPIRTSCCSSRQAARWAALK
jgi:hypothetical protein